MIFNNVVFYCVLLLFAKVVISDEGKNKTYKNSDVKDTFANLLKTIVKVNEERMKALQKVIRLQDYILTKNKLNIDEDAYAYDSWEEEDSQDNRVFVVRRYAGCPTTLPHGWKASTENEEKIRYKFRSNFTRNDFSNLLQSLIKMNKQRISALHKLNRLEDYGVLSEDIEEPEETSPYIKYKMPMLPWIESLNHKNNDKDSSADSNSDEYSDPNTETDSDIESSYYHEDGYFQDTKMDLPDFEPDKLGLRKRWKKCRKNAAKVCREACTVSYKNACDECKCRKRLKRSLKKQCKQNCYDFFADVSV